MPQVKNRGAKVASSALPLQQQRISYIKIYLGDSRKQITLCATAEGICPLLSPKNKGSLIVWWEGGGEESLPDLFISDL